MSGATSGRPRSDGQQIVIESRPDDRRGIQRALGGGVEDESNACAMVA